MFLPGFVVRFAVWLLTLLDAWGLMPRALHRVSPFHTSVFITDLGSLGGSHTWAFDISGAGQIVGSSTLPGQGAYDPTRAILFSEGRLVDLNDYVDDASALFSPLSSATAINDAGWIVANACRPQPYNDCIAYRLTPIYSR
jgi:probable HAF family extracellular repeat protein